MYTWQPIQSAPFGRYLQLSVIEGQVHALAFPCRRTERGWVNRAGKTIKIRPSHWRDWTESDRSQDCAEDCVSAGARQ